jgi:hypothetical protein
LSSTLIVVLVISVVYLFVANVLKPTHVPVREKEKVVNKR